MNNDWARPVVHFEIEALDPIRQRAFYAALFNWDISDGAIMSFRLAPAHPRRDLQATFAAATEVA
jgi:predicted enzyme related to lactoylglutathione lyase